MRERDRESLTTTNNLKTHIMLIHENVKYNIKIVFILTILRLSKKTKREVKLRIAEHRGTINNEKLDKFVGVHFNKSGHKLSDFSFSVLEKCYKQCPNYLRKREEHWIQRFQTKFKGLNKIS